MADHSARVNQLTLSESYQTERRILTICFADIVSSTELAESLSLDEYDDILQDFRALVEQVFTRFRGKIIAHLGDGVMACFGLSESAEDAALAGLGSGLALVAEVESELKVCQVRVGLHSGEVLCRLTAADCDLSHMTGLDINIAARIQAEARPSTVMISNQFLDFVQRIACIDVAESRDVVLKGMSTPVRLHEVNSFKIPRPSARFQNLMEREDLLQLCECYASGNMMLVGPPGIGKTALVQTLMARQAAPEDVVVLTARSNLTRSALFPLTEWLAEQLSAKQDSAAHIQALLPALDTLQKEGLSEIVDPGRLSVLHPERSFRVRREIRLEVATVILANHLSRPSALLIFDDFHWSDTDSCEVIQRLLRVRHSGGGRIILFSRPTPEAMAFAEEEGVTLHAVQPLSTHACRALIKNEVMEEISEVALARIVTTSGGNPLFIKLLARAKVLHSFGLENEQTPPTIDATIQYLLGELGELKRLVMAAAVIGRSFQVNHLRYLADPQTDIEAFIIRLIRLDIFVAEQSGYGFQHILLRDCAYNMLPLRLRRALHGQLAKALMQNDPSFCSAYPELISDHFFAAQSMDEAVVTGLAAGIKFLGSAQFDYAATYLDRVIAALTQKVEKDDATADLLIRAQTLLGTTQVQRFGFSHPAVIQTYEDLDQLVTRHNAGRLERLHALYGLYAHSVIGGKVRDARKVLNRMEKIADPAAPNQQLLCLVNRSAQHLYSGDFHDLRMVNKRIFETYVTASHGQIFLDVGADPLVCALTAECHALAINGELNGAKTARDAALSHIKQIDAKMQLPWVHIFAAQSFHFAGDVIERQKSISEGLELADAQGSAFWSLVGRMWQGVFAVDEGDIDYGEAVLEALIPAADEIGMQVGWPIFTATLARAKAARGDKILALQLSRAALRRIAKHGEFIWAPAVRSRHRDIMSNAEKYRVIQSSTVQDSISI